MGNSTIIEFNHDRWDEVFESEEAQKEFLKQIREQYKSFKHNGCRILGGNVITGCHRSEKIYELFSDWKRLVNRRNT